MCQFCHLREVGHDSMHRLDADINGECGLLYQAQVNTNNVIIGLLRKLYIGLYSPYGGGGGGLNEIRNFRH